MEINAKITEDLLPLAYPVDKLRLLPGNPNKGNVKAVAKSLKKFGQLKAIVARKEPDGQAYVLAGNTTLQAARDELHWSHIAVVWADELSDKEKLGFALADNHTAELGETDEEALLKMLQEIEDDFDIIDATGYDLTDIQDIEIALNDDSDDFYKSSEQEQKDSDEESTVRNMGTPTISYTIIFDDDLQQQSWFDFVRGLKPLYPEAETVAARILLYIEDHG